MEKNYDFRARHWQVHKPHRRDESRLPAQNEVLIENGWFIGCEDGLVMNNAAEDLMDYFFVSMGLGLARTAEKRENTVWFTVDETLERGFVLNVTTDGVLVRLAADKEAFRASVYLEDIMNLEGAPVVPMGETVRKPLFLRRSVHSGTGIDEYPDAELRAIVHGGYDRIELFVKGFDETTQGHCNINDVIARAKAFGLDVRFYNYMRSYVHPDDPKAAEVFDATYGELFRRYPDAAGMSLTGESLEFPSKDPHTTGKRYNESIIDGIPDTRPSPGWYPCYDYPAYLEGIAKAVHAVKPDAELSYSTYNWSYESAELRDAFLARIPKCFNISICYEIRSKRTVEGLKTPIMDYSISQSQPSDYFTTESASCKRYGLSVIGNVNTAGIGWDFGCVPVVPTPRQILQRQRIVRAAHDTYGVERLYATHHYGWWNSFAADLGKWTSWEGFEPDYDELLRKIAVRDYGKEAAPHVLKAWELWADAIGTYTATNEDQYGPWRVGAAYPFIFQPNITRTMLGKEIQFPTAPHAHFGYKIVKTLYQPYENAEQAPGFLRYPAEIRALEKMRTGWEAGMQEIRQAENTEEGKRMAALGQFILCSTNTVIHIKKWWMANMRLQLSANQQEALERLDELVAIAEAERQNVKNCIPAVQTDSRLGWEPSMEYVCDAWHLDWKQRQLDSALREVEIYRSIVENAYAK